ncbi:MAG: aspartate-semialdehyde dehydrogenase [Oscillospiraceae bacterium]|nr:aspartate-semialdehyde dehydrogenase [Oscillospiraceae bacterium]
MKTYTVAILGATGAVGKEMIKILQERDFPVGELRLLASKRSVGALVPFKGSQIAVQEACEEAFRGVDIVLGAAENDIAQRFAPAITAAGAVFVDNSSAFRLCDDVPLVVPEVNGADVKKHKGIISNPNCSTIITVTAVAALNAIAPIESMVVSTYQAVSGAGAGGPVELMNEVEALRGGEHYEPKVFSHQIAYNLIPQIGGEQEDGYTSEEMKLQYEGRKILHLPDLAVSCTCVRVPVVRSHSISARLKFARPISVEEARAAIAAADGCRLVDDLSQKQYPMPLDTSDQDLVFVGRIRPDLTDEKGLCLWCCGDQVRKGAATNAVQIAELLIR